MKKRIFKFNKEDILEILVEALAKKNGFSKFNSRSDLIIDNGNVYFVGVIGKERDEEIKNIDLLKLYNETEYNGTHDGTGSYTAEKWEEILEMIYKKGTF